MFRKRWPAYVSFVSVAAALPARAAEMTDVADAADVIVIGNTEREDVFDLYVGSNFRMEMANGKITREPINRPGVQGQDCTGAQNARDCLPVDELRWRSSTSIIDMNMEVGIFHDLALTFGTHYVLGDEVHYRLAKGVTESTSSVMTMPGATDPTLFPVSPDPFVAKHAGWGSLDMGMKFGALNDERDDSKPSWVVEFNWASPWISSTFDPDYLSNAKNRASKDNPGPVGDGVHRLRFGMAFSKRVGNFGLIGIDPNANRYGYVDPYFEIAYTLPVPQKSLALSAISPNKNDPFAKRPSQEAEMNAGVEIVPVEDLTHSRKVALDFGIRTVFCSEGRNTVNFSGNCRGGLLVDPLADPLYTEQYFVVKGLVGLYIQAAEFIRFKAGVSLGYTTEHFLTYEEVGNDKNDDGQVIPPDQDTHTVKDEVNTQFCGNDPNDICSAKGQPSYDQVGLRFKDEEHVVFNWFASLTFTF